MKRRVETELNILGPQRRFGLMFYLPQSVKGEKIKQISQVRYFKTNR